MRPLRDAGLELHMFLTDEGKDGFDWIHRYYKGADTRNLIPERSMFERRFPTIPLPEPPMRRMTLEALASLVKDGWLKRKAENILEDLSDLLIDDPRAAIAAAAHDFRSLAVEGDTSHDIILADNSEAALERYNLAQQSDGMWGIPWPASWGRSNEDGSPRIKKATGRQDHPLNEQTQGIQNEDLIIIYGRPKSMKTWLMVNLAAECYIKQHCRVLFFTKEMSCAQIRMRMDSALIRAPYMELKTGQLEYEKEGEYISMLLELPETERRMNSRGHEASMLITGGRGHHDMDHLYAKIDEFEPDIVFADAVYLFKEGQSKKALWERTTGTSRGLNSICKSRYHIPVIGSTQANRGAEETKGGSTVEVAYSDAFIQDCDLAMRVIKLDGETPNTAKLGIVIPAGREVVLAGFMLDVYPAAYFRLDRIFESQRSVQALFRAEASRVEAEERREADRIVRTGHKFGRKRDEAPPRSAKEQKEVRDRRRQKKKDG